MSTETQHLLHKSFLSGYFHEDWPCEADSPEAVIAGFGRTAHQGDIHELREAIVEISAGSESDAELKEQLFADLGCYDRPSGAGASVRLWLAGLPTHLLESPNYNAHITL